MTNRTRQEWTALLNRSRTFILMLSITLLVAPLSWAQEPEPQDLALEMELRGETPGLSGKAAPVCGGGYCLGLVPDLVSYVLVFESSGSPVWVGATSVLKSAMADVGCTSNAYLLAVDSNRYELVALLTAAEALGVRVRIHFGPSSEGSTSCRVRWIYRFTS